MQLLVLDIRASSMGDYELKTNFRENRPCKWQVLIYSMKIVEMVLVWTASMWKTVGLAEDSRSHLSLSLAFWIGKARFGRHHLTINHPGHPHVGSIS